MTAASWVEWCQWQRPACLPDGFDPTVKVPLSVVEALAVLAAAAHESLEDLSPVERAAVATLERQP